MLLRLWMAADTGMPSGLGQMTSMGPLSAWWVVLAQAGGGHAIERGPGGYFSLGKLLLIWLLLLAWVAIGEWINKDAQKLNMRYMSWNAVIVLTFFAGVILAVSIPMFAVGGTIMTLSLFGPTIAYIVVRNGQVESHRRVLTGEHLWYLLATYVLQKMGLKVAVDKRDSHEKGPPVNFHAMGGATEQDNQANVIRARQSEGYVTAKELFSDALGRRVDKIMLDYGQENVTVRYQIDGVWHEAESQEREQGDAMLLVLKTLANLNPKERRARQEGQFRAEHKRMKMLTKVVSQGTKSGERVILHLQRPAEGLETLADLGMREKMIEGVRGVLREEQGIVLFSSMPADGLSTTVSAALATTDRFLNDFTVLYTEEEPQLVVDNLSVETYNPQKDPPHQALLRIIRKDPDAIVMPELPNGECVKLMCEHAKDKKIFIATIRAKEAVEALLRVLLLKVPATEFAPAVLGVINQRLVRKLCEECKEAYKPSPELLKKLGFPAGRIDAFYRPPEKEPNEDVCEQCDGIGYFGRTAIYEFLLIQDDLREVLIKQPKPDVLRKVARKNKHRSLQEEGLLLVARGVTSLNELQRALKS